MTAYDILPADAHDLIVFLNRVQTSGIAEAQRLSQLAQKLVNIRDAKTEDAVEDDDSTD